MDKQAQSEPAEAATTLEHRMLEILQNMEVTAVSQDDALERVELLVSEHQHPSMLDEVTLQLQVEEAASSSSMASTEKLFSSQTQALALSYLDRLVCDARNIYLSTAKDELFTASMVILSSCIFLPLMVYIFQIPMSSYLPFCSPRYGRRDIDASTSEGIFSRQSEVQVVYTSLKRVYFRAESTYLEDLFQEEIKCLRNKLNKLVDIDGSSKIENLADEYERIRARVSNFQSWVKALLTLLRVDEVDAELNLHKVKLQTKLAEALKIDINNLATDLQRVSPFRRDDAERCALDRLRIKLEEDEGIQTLLIEKMMQQRENKQEVDVYNSENDKFLSKALFSSWDRQELVIFLMKHICICKQISSAGLKSVSDEKIRMASMVLEFVKEQELLEGYAEIEVQQRIHQQSIGMEPPPNSIHSPHRNCDSSYPYVSSSTVSSEIMPCNSGNGSENRSSDYPLNAYSAAITTNSSPLLSLTQQVIPSGNQGASNFFCMLSDHDRKKEYHRISEKYIDKKLDIRREIEKKWEDKWEKCIQKNQCYFENMRRKEKKELGIDQTLNLIRSLQDDCFSLEYMQSRLHRATTLHKDEYEKMKLTDNMFFLCTAIFVIITSMYVNYAIDNMGSYRNVCDLKSFFSIESIPSLAYHLLSKKVCSSSSFLKYNGFSGNELSQYGNTYGYGYMQWTFNSAVSNTYFLESMFCGIDIAKTVLVPLSFAYVLKYLPFLKSKSDYVQISMIFYFLVSDMVAALVRILGLHFAIFLLLRFYPHTSWFGSARYRSILMYFMYPCLLVLFTVIIMVHSETGLELHEIELYRKVYHIHLQCFSTIAGKDDDAS